MPNVSIVTSVQTLNAALANAHGGDTIELAPGSYSGVVISNLTFSTGVNITSESNTSKAVLVGLKVASSSGINFSNLVMSTVGVSDPYYAFRITASQNLSFSGVSVQGSSTLAPGSQTSGFLIEHSSGITIKDSAFQYLNNGIAAEFDDNLNFSNNNFTYMSKGGIQCGQVSDVTISNNNFTNFETAAGVHSDAIQFFTAGTSASSQNITINDNTYIRGTGSAAQGIFLNDEVGNLPYINVSIDGNQIVGGDWNSIYLNHASGLVSLGSNYTASWTGVDVVSGSLIQDMQGRIVLGNLTGALLTENGNVAQGFISGSTSVSPPPGNTILGAIAPVSSLPPVTSKLIVQPSYAAVAEHQTSSGNLLSSGDGATFVTAVGVGSGAQKSVSAAGTTFVGSYGSLTVHQDGSYSYTETKDSLNVGQTYTDSFSTTVSTSSGQAAVATLQVTVTGSATGNGGYNTILAGSGSETISGFGPKSVLTAGTGTDIFQYTNLNQSTPINQTRIQNFTATDIIDLSAVDPNFHIVKSFDGHANELVITRLGTGNAWAVYGDTTGTGHADFQIYIPTGPAALTAANFHL